MKITVNGEAFEMPWEDGWIELREWFNASIDDGYEVDDDGDVSAYPVVQVNVDLPQQIIIGVCYGAGMQFGSVPRDGQWDALWYCEPRVDQFMRFLDHLRIAEHNFSAGAGIYSVAGGKWAGDNGSTREEAP
jgi:hypothetical protein